MDQKFQAGKDKKLVIARALYIDPKILILDEATNSMDKKNEELVKKLYYELQKIFNMHYYFS